MDAAAVKPQYELLRDDIVERNRTEIAQRLKEAGFEEDFSNLVVQTSRAASSIKSSTTAAVKRDRRRRRSPSHELDFVPRQSTRQPQRRAYYEPEEASQPTGNAKVYVSDSGGYLSRLFFEKTSRCVEVACRGKPKPCNSRHSLSN